MAVKMRIVREIDHALRAAAERLLDTESADRLGVLRGSRATAGDCSIFRNSGCVMPVPMPAAAKSILKKDGRTFITIYDIWIYAAQPQNAAFIRQSMLTTACFGSTLMRLRKS